MLDTYAHWAGRLYPRRWQFAVATLLVFLALLLLMSTRMPSAVYIGVLLAGPLIAISWGLVCLCVWFEPTRGKLQTGWLITHLPKPVRSILRWYFAIFLLLWFVLGVGAWPLLAIWDNAWSNIRWSGP
jgi:hypothetical protein